MEDQPDKWYYYIKAGADGSLPKVVSSAPFHKLGSE